MTTHHDRWRSSVPRASQGSGVGVLGRRARQRYLKLDLGLAHLQLGETYAKLGFGERPVKPEYLVQAGVIVEDGKSLLTVNGHAEYDDLHLPDIG